VETLSFEVCLAIVFPLFSEQSTLSGKTLSMRIVTRRLPYAQLFTVIVVGVFLLILDGYKLLLCIDTLETPKVRLILGYSTGYQAALHLAFMFYNVVHKRAPHPSERPTKHQRSVRVATQYNTTTNYYTIHNNVALFRSVAIIYI